jgi:hypothetical protein
MQFWVHPDLTTRPCRASRASRSRRVIRRPVVSIGRCNTCQHGRCGCTHSDPDRQQGNTDDTDDSTEDTDLSPAALPPRRTGPDDDLGSSTPENTGARSRPRPFQKSRARGARSRNYTRSDRFNQFSSGSCPYPFAVGVSCGSSSFTRRRGEERVHWTRTLFTRNVWGSPCPFP